MHIIIVIIIIREYFLIHVNEVADKFYHYINKLIGPECRVTGCIVGQKIIIT
jgi:hypothetical protein